MSKTTTNILAIVITILAGTYFFVTYCNGCTSQSEKVPETFQEETTSATGIAASATTFYSAMELQVYRTTKFGALKYIIHPKTTVL